MSITYTTRIVTTTPYNVVLKDEVIFINVAGPASVRLPNITDDNDYHSFYIKDYSGISDINPITITAPGKTIDGVSFAILNNGYSHIQVVYDGTNWKIIS